MIRLAIALALLLGTATISPLAAQSPDIAASGTDKVALEVRQATEGWSPDNASLNSARQVLAFRAKTQSSLVVARRNAVQQPDTCSPVLAA